MTSGSTGRRARGSATLTVLCWHNVRQTWRFASATDAGVRGFGAQLAALQRVANIVDAGDAVRSLREGRPLPPRSVALTFDDGYEDNLHDVAPMLEASRLPATFFVVPAYLDGRDTPWWERLAWAVTTTDATGLCWDSLRFPLTSPDSRRVCISSLERRLKRMSQAARVTVVEAIAERLAPTRCYSERATMLDWDGAAHLARQGFAIGSHSSRHAILANESPASQKNDLVESRRALDSGLGVDATLCAYPNGTSGDFDVTTEDAARAAGYEAAFTTIPGVNTAETPEFSLRRVAVDAGRGVRGLRPVFRLAAERAQRAFGPRRRSLDRRPAPR